METHLHPSAPRTAPSSAPPLAPSPLEPSPEPTEPPVAAPEPIVASPRRHLSAREWRAVLAATWRRYWSGELGILSGGVAYFAVIALVPTATALVALYGLVADPIDVENQLRPVTRLLPADARDLLISQLERLARAPSGEVGFAFAAALAIALISALSSTNALITALNFVYRVRERRGALRLTLTALGLTVGAILGVAVVIGVIVALPPILRLLRIETGTVDLVALLRWPGLVALVMTGLAVLYRYGPSHERAAWRWVSAGSLAAALIWLIASLLLSLYVDRLANYRVYGAFGSAVVLMLWLYLSALAILYGGALNAELASKKPLTNT